MPKSEGLEVPPLRALQVEAGPGLGAMMEKAHQGRRVGVPAETGEDRYPVP